MRPSENNLNGFFLRRAGLGHLEGKSRGAELDRPEDIAKSYYQMAELSPRATSFISGMAKLGKMAQTDAETFEEVTRKVPGVEWEHVAKIPADLWNLILQKDPDLLQDEKRFEKFLASDEAAFLRVRKDARKGKSEFRGRKGSKDVLLHPSG